jgi:hypothetical protein
VRPFMGQAPEAALREAATTHRVSHTEHDKRLPCLLLTSRLAPLNVKGVATFCIMPARVKKKRSERNEQEEEAATTQQQGSPGKLWSGRENLTYPGGPMRRWLRRPALRR